MNALQISPLGATAPPTSPGKDPAASLASSPSPSAKPKFKPDIGPETGTEQKLAEARAHSVQVTDDQKAQAEKAQAEKAQAEKEAAARKKAAEEAVTLDIKTLDREVGLVEGTTKVFVDLVDPVHNTSLFRVFGPSDKAAEAAPEPRPAPPGAANAYTLAGATLPLKDLGVA